MRQVPAALQKPAANEAGRVVTLLTVLGIAVVVGVVAIGTLVLTQSRADVWERAQQSADNLSLALQRDIGRNISVIDLSLQGALYAIREPGISDVSPAIRQAAIFDRAATAEYVGSMLVMDAAGKIIASSAQTPAGLDLTDRDYFGVHKRQADAGLFISHVFHSRVQNGTASIAISRRMAAADGSFGGIVRAALDVQFFTHLFSDLELGQHGTVALFRSDGQMIARHPAKDGDIGRDMATSETFKHVSAALTGSYVGTGTDGIERLYTFRRIGDLPLIVSVGLSVEDIYAGWWLKAAAITGMLGALCAAICVLCISFRLEIIRRLAVESALAENAASLATLASTDGLTGLANRRTFEIELCRAWRQSMRASKSMSVLMLDADCFKSYNDTYGHQAGDEALSAIAQCIGANVNRPLDCAARYGGEEFVVVLPETDMEGGQLVAEHIRRSVEALGLRHAGSPSGLVTVSVGVASGMPTPTDHAGSLVTAADDMLYKAKRGGRNMMKACRFSEMHERGKVAAGKPEPVGR